MPTRKTQGKPPHNFLNENHYRSLFAAMTESFSLRELVFNSKGKVVDYRFLEVNPSFEKFIGFKRKYIIGKLRSEIPVAANKKTLDIYTRVALTGKPARFETYNKSMNLPAAAERRGF